MKFFYWASMLLIVLQVGCAMGDGGGDGVAAPVNPSPPVATPSGHPGGEGGDGKKEVSASHSVTLLSFPLPSAATQGPG